MIKSTPEPHQNEGAEFLSKKKVALLGFKTGKGKSLTLLLAIHKYVNRDTGRQAIIFAPKNATQKVWNREIEKHTDLRWAYIKDVIELYQLYKNWDFLKSYELIICRYSEVYKYRNYLASIVKGRITAYDEAHKLKNPNAKLVYILKKATEQAACKWGLTATSVLNSIMDLWGMTQFFDYRIFGSEQDFKDQYCVMESKVIGYNRSLGRPRKVWEIVDYKNLDQLKSIREKFIMISEQDVDVKFNEIPYVELEEETEVYLRAAMGILVDGDRNYAARLHDLQRACDGSRDIYGQPRVDYRSSKYKEYIKKLKELYAKGDSTILFVEYHDTFKMIMNLLPYDMPGVPIYSISAKEVQDAEKFPCVVVSMAGGSESLNLGFANHVLFYSIPFSVGSFIQTAGRITRMDSKYLDDLNVYMPINPSTIDFYKFKLLEMNAGLINELLGHDANLPKEVETMRKDLIHKMKKELLWRTKQTSKVFITKKS